jgi:hypothetical protein
MSDKEEIERVYNLIVENLQFFKEQKSMDYSIQSDLRVYKQVLKRFKTKDERLKALIMLYTVNVGIWELNWDIVYLIQYIYDTVEEQYLDKYNELFDIIEEGE